MFEENVELHVSLPVELPRTVRTVVAHWLTFPAPPRLGMAGLVLDQLLLLSEVPAAVRANVKTVGVGHLDVVGQVLPQVRLETKYNQDNDQSDWSSLQPLSTCS